MNLIFHKAASILVYRYYQAHNYWFLNDYGDTTDIINSRAIIQFVMREIDLVLEKGEGILEDIRLEDLIDFKDNLKSKIEFTNRICGIEEYADVVLDEEGDTSYRYCLKDKHWDPVPMNWMVFISPNDQYELGVGLQDLLVEYEASRDSLEVTGGRTSDRFDAILYTTTTELKYDSELANEIRDLSYRFYDQVIKEDDSIEEYWNDTFRIWYEMDTILDELGSKVDISAEQKACLTELRFNRFSIQAEKGIWIGYKKSNPKVLALTSGNGEYSHEIEVESL